MGLFDFFRKGASTPPPSGASKKIAGPAKLVSDKRAQPYDRTEAIRQLVALRSPETADALLKRFTFTIDPSITDQEEKEEVYAGIVAIGEAALPAVQSFCARAEGLTWPIRILREILSRDAYRAELLRLLESFDTEYARNVDPKIQVIGALSEVVHEDVRTAVEPFLEDVNETVRYQAVHTVCEQHSAESVDALVALLEREESVRIKNKICEGLSLRGWAIPVSLREQARTALRDVGAYELAADGTIARR
jgi:hypothetical protein